MDINTQVVAELSKSSGQGGQRKTLYYIHQGRAQSKDLLSYTVVATIDKYKLSQVS
jgi:hypothetical protein